MKPFEDFDSTNFDSDINIDGVTKDTNVPGFAVNELESAAKGEQYVGNEDKEKKSALRIVFSLCAALLYLLIAWKYWLNNH